MRKFSKVVQGDDNAYWVATDLVHESQWFEFEPLPDGAYEFTVKGENEQLLGRIIVNNMC
ncbi:MAG: hypothetical protein GY832_31705 [Chloroflexi bacterium]|nr:hypothetical protein [Chloroflexota bacterium]